MTSHVISMPSPKISRRDLLKKSVAVSASLVAGSGFLASSNASWAMEVKALTPDTMATLVQLARDIYPHDRFGDELYAAAVKSHDAMSMDDPEYKRKINVGVTVLNNLAEQRGHDSYASIGWESDRLKILKSMEKNDFFQTIRGGLVVGLYNQQEAWDKLGYEGASFDKGGYINRGFDDITWL